MPKPVKIVWPVASANSVCLLQTTSGAGSLLINGGLATTNTNVPTYAVFTGINRVVTLTSANNLSAVNVTITGYFQGALVSETRVGPNANTVATTQTFDSVIAVSVGAAVTALSVGTGTTGSMKWVSYDFYIPTTTISVNTVATATINYTYQVTFDNVNSVASPVVFSPVATLIGATTSLNETVTPTYSWARVLINSSDATGALVFYTSQMGIRG